MAVTLTVIEAAADRRLGDGVTEPAEPINGVLTRLLATATAIVENYAPNAPESVQNTATSLILGYLYDAPIGDSTRFANSLANSGAQLILARYVSRAIAIVDGSGDPIITLPLGDGGLDAAHVTELLHALVEAWAFIADDTKIPLSKLPDNIGGNAEDATARAAAVANAEAIAALEVGGGPAEVGSNASFDGLVGRWRQSGITIPSSDFYIELSYNGVWQGQQRVYSARLSAFSPVVVGQASGSYIQLADVDNQSFYLSHDASNNIVVASHPGNATMGMRVIA